MHFEIIKYHIKHFENVDKLIEKRHTFKNMYFILCIYFNLIYSYSKYNSFYSNKYWIVFIVST